MSNANPEPWEFSETRKGMSDEEITVERQKMEKTATKFGKSWKPCLDIEDVRKRMSAEEFQRRMESAERTATALQKVWPKK